MQTEYPSEGMKRREFIGGMGVALAVNRLVRPLVAASGKLHIISLSFDDGFKKSFLRTAEIYEKFRQRLLGKRYRRLSDKHLELAKFSAMRPEDETLKKKMAAWNRRQSRRPKWKYSEVTNFGRDIAGARSRLLEPFKGELI